MGILSLPAELHAWIRVWYGIWREPVPFFWCGVPPIIRTRPERTWYGLGGTPHCFSSAFFIAGTLLFTFQNGKPADS